MHLFVIVSSVYIGFLIYKSCTRKPDYDVDIYHKICNNFPTSHYLSRISLMAFFNQPENFEKLDKVFSNNIFKKMIDSVEKNENLKKEYEFMKESLGSCIFSYDKTINIPFEFNDKVFKTNTANLNFIRWFIISDNFLYIEKLEN